MLVSRRHIHALDVISVLGFSLFASYIISVDIAQGDIFRTKEVLRSLILLASCGVFYFTVDYLKKIEQEAIREYENERDVSKKASKSINARYEAFYRERGKRINFSFLVAIIFFVAFFVFNPIAEYASNSKEIIATDDNR